MNRFSNYLESSKLARLHLREAQKAETDHDLPKAVRHQRAAMDEALTAMNNVASLYFERRKKR